jgi:hypothetical protein
MNVKSVSADGTVTLEIVRAFRVMERGQSEDTPAPIVEVQMRPTGEILRPAGEKARARRLESTTLLAYPSKACRWWASPSPG